MCMSILHTHMFIYYVCAHGSQKRALDTLGTVVINCSLLPVCVLETEPGISRRATSPPNCKPFFSSPLQSIVLEKPE